MSDYREWNMDGGKFWHIDMCEDLFSEFDTSAHLNNGVPDVPVDKVLAHIEECDECTGRNVEVSDRNGRPTLHYDGEGYMPEFSVQWGDNANTDISGYPFAEQDAVEVTLRDGDFIVAHWSRQTTSVGWTFRRSDAYLTNREQRALSGFRSADDAIEAAKEQYRVNASL